MVYGILVFGEVDLAEATKMLLTVSHYRSAEYLLKIIEDHVAEGSIIATAYWKGFNSLSSWIFIFTKQ